jgi:hypothetical protein
MNTIFTENKYNRWYFSIINRSVLECRKYDPALHEKHHIIPTSLGGTNQSKNLAVLTFREHFICHMLLTKFTTSSNKTKMHCALRMMMNKSKLNHRVLTQRQYEIARNALSKIKRKMSPEFCEKQRLNRIGSKNPMCGKKQTQKQKEIVSNFFSKTYTFLLNGEKITITNLKKYCEENNLTRGKMSELHHNKIKKYKNYTGLNFGNAV